MRNKVFILLNLFLLIFFQGNSQKLLRSEMLGRPTDNSITIQTIFADSVEIRAEYGSQSGVFTNQTPWKIFANGITSETIISGLMPDTKYYYRLNYRNPSGGPIVFRPEFSFHTQRAAGSSFTFVVQADPHIDYNSDTALYRVCLKNQLDDAPDFMIDLGDFLMTDKLKNASKVIPRDTIPFRCNLLRSFYEKTCHSVPLFIALGNHEGESGWNLNGNENNIAVWNSLERKKYFLNPYPNNFYGGDTTTHKFIGQRGNYYSWEWGDALFIVLDPYWYTGIKPDSLHGWRWTLGETQYKWLRSTLENSKAGFKYVFAHQLIGGDPDGRGGVEFANLYEWGGDNLDGTPGFATNRPGWYKPIKDLLTENRVNIFFHGHDHFFGKQEKECLIYQETPQPSLHNFTTTSAKDYGYLQGQILPNTGHLRVTVSSIGTKVEYVRAFKPADENATRHNKDVSASYFIGNVNCYDSISAGTPIIWNSSYADEIVYPNPFMQETRIEFKVNVAENIWIYIYDEKGSLARKLINGNPISTGKYQVVWDGKNESGEDLPTGIYWYHINGKRSGKIMLKR